MTETATTQESVERTQWVPRAATRHSLPFTIWAVPLTAVLLGAALAVVVGWAEPVRAIWWAITGIYLVTANVLLVAGLVRSDARRFGWANVVTSARSAIVGVITGSVAASFFASSFFTSHSALSPAFVPVLVALCVPALALDAVDGWVARRTGTVTALGGRFDMEVDAFLLLVLSAYVAPILGWWVLAIGLMRYVFVAAGWLLPWLRTPLPPRYWRKVVTAVAGIALTVAASGLLPALLPVGLSAVLPVGPTPGRPAAGAVVDVVLVAVALALLIESFGRDVVWLVRRRGHA